MPLRAALHGRKLGTLSALPLDTPSQWPTVSVLVPAKNEEDTLFSAMQSLLQVDYPALEIILINDRSTDRTGEIIDRLAQLDARVRQIHIDHLPDGWLGKVHALDQGIDVSSGEWLLFTDADIHFAPQTLKRALSYCIQYRKGFLALFPDIENARALVGSAQAEYDGGDKHRDDDRQRDVCIHVVPVRNGHLDPDENQDAAQSMRQVVKTFFGVCEQEVHRS